VQQSTKEPSCRARWIAAANSKTATLEERKAIAEQYLSANLMDHHAGSRGSAKVNVVNGEVVVTVDADYPMRFMRVVGIFDQKIGARARVVIPIEKDAEIALVLDYSGSMNSKGKYQAMRDAASNMIDIVTVNGTKTDRVKFGLVLFSHHVNLSLPGEYVVDEAAGTTWSNCTQDRKYPYNIEYTVPDASDIDTLWGMSPTNGYDVGAYAVCKQYELNKLIVAPLTNNAEAAKTQLAAMTPHNLTHISLGTEFGWALLSPDAPFTEAAAYTDEEVEKYLVVLTDGVQTEKAWMSAKRITPEW
jgi:hypothetical protein